MVKWLLLVTLLTPSVVLAQTLEQRVERLEEIASNPVTIQLGQRLDFQANEIAQIQDRLDRLVFQNQQLQRQLERHIEQASQRITQLEAQLQAAAQQGLLSEPNALAEQGELTLTIADEFSEQSELGLEQDATQTALDVSPTEVTLEFAPEQSGDINERELIVLDTSPQGEMQQAYDQAFALLGTGDYDAAQEALSAFIASYPNENLTADAYYWLGESWLIQQDFAQAIQAFQKVIEDFSDHPRYENALLRGADSLVGLNDLDQAITLYNRVIEQFPQSRAAQSAQDRLTRLQVLN
ncbi:tol-pal system protein YbgF [Thiomicrospira aerophila AL3]|uniref:Cell division coordinator CpoB n=1 Tax=Thiomicrospira aerophila AL3 TaxID=717772 RepID=W0DQY9_9GAMM|nr:tol-pal system protein YbgF [Thiomicrospira aerophila]AHF01040.1 tol-pal system protein YbgF [Thiomicrospira aerophila AL3]